MPAPEPLSLAAAYRAKLASGEIAPDAAQGRAVEALCRGSKAS